MYNTYVYIYIYNGYFLGLLVQFKAKSFPEPLPSQVFRMTKALIRIRRDLSNGSKCGHGVKMVGWGVVDDLRVDLYLYLYIHNIQLYIIGVKSVKKY